MKQIIIRGNSGDFTYLCTAKNNIQLYFCVGCNCLAALLECNIKEQNKTWLCFPPVRSRLANAKIW